jgi:hypothetical protein
MEIETIADVCEQIADWCGVYGCCKAVEHGSDGCDETDIKCCRVGFVSELEDRIRKAVENEEMLKRGQKNHK